MTEQVTGNVMLRLAEDMTLSEIEREIVASRDREVQMLNAISWLYQSYVLPELDEQFRSPTEPLNKTHKQRKIID